MTNYKNAILITVYFEYQHSMNEVKLIQCTFIIAYTLYYVLYSYLLYTVYCIVYNMTIIV